MSLITIKPAGGLCNRLRAMDSALGLAPHLGSQLKVVWECNSELNCRFEELFEPIAGVEMLNISSKDKSLWPVWIRRWLNRRRYPRDAQVGSKLFQIVERCFPYKPADVVRLQDEFSKLAGELNRQQELPNMEEFDAAYIAELAPWIESLNPSQSLYLCSCYRFFPTEPPFHQFRPTPAIQATIDRHVKLFRDTIGIHIRRTDHVASIQNSPIGMFVDAIQREIAATPTATFYLATDDAEVKSELQQTFGDRILTHQVDFTRKSAQGIRDAMVDLYCLASTRKIYGSFGSSFTHTAALIGGINRQVLRLAS